jgi:acetyltransferase-like isoleucine patch superfamily enzyme
MKFNYGIFKSAMHFLYRNLVITEKSPNSRTYKKTNLTEKDIEIGDYTYGAQTCSIYNWNEIYKVRIGKFCSIAGELKILVDGNHRSDWITTFPFEIFIEGFPQVEGISKKEGDIVIGNDVWIGIDVLILPGIKIGDGAIIGAGSVVTKDVEDYQIVGGSPARHIRYRFSKEHIEELKRIKWWDWPIEKIRANSKFLESSDIEKFIELNK